MTLGDLEQHQRGLQWTDDGFALLWAAGLNVTQDTALTGWICVADDLQALFVSMVESIGALPYRVARGGRDSSHTAWFPLLLGLRISGVGGIHKRKTQCIARLAAVAGQSDGSVPDRPRLAHFLDVFGRLTTGRHHGGRAAFAASVLAARRRHICADAHGSFSALATGLAEAADQARAERCLNGNTLPLSRVEAVRVRVVLSGSAARAHPLWQGADDLQSTGPPTGRPAERAGHDRTHQLACGAQAAAVARQGKAAIAAPPEPDW